MKAIRIHQQGDPEVMQWEDVPLPEPAEGQVRVKIAAVGVNYIDIYQRSGQYKVPLPFTPGMEAAGVVDAIGPGVTDFAIGGRVAYGFTTGAYAEYALVPADKLVPLPDNIALTTAAAAMLQGMTGHYLVTDTFAVQPGQTVLVHAAAGGAGGLIVQMAKLKGARVLATVSTEAKAEAVRGLGADEVYLYGDFEAGVKAATHGAGVHVVYDSVGKDTFEASLNCLRPRGMLALFGQASGAVGPFDPQILNSKGSLFMTRPSLGHYLLTREEMLRRAQDLFAWIGSSDVKIRIDRALPVAQAAEAHRALASRGTQGKIILTP